MYYEILQKVKVYSRPLVSSLINYSITVIPPPKDEEESMVGLEHITKEKARDEIEKNEYHFG